MDELERRGWHLIHGPLAPCPACGSTTEPCPSCRRDCERLAAALAAELGHTGDLFAELAQATVH